MAKNTTGKKQGLSSAVFGSWKLLSRSQKFELATLAGVSVAVNFLDVVALGIVGTVAAVALGGTVSFPVLSEIMSNGEEGTIFLLLVALALFIAKSAVGAILSYLQNMALAKLQTEFSFQIARAFFAGGLGTMRTMTKSELQWSIVNSTSVAFGSVLRQVFAVVTHGSLALVILAMFFWTDWLSASVILLYLAGVVGFFTIVSRPKIRDTGRDVSAGTVSIVEDISDGVVAYREIEVYSRTDHFLDRIVSSRRKIAVANARQVFVQSLPRLILELALIVGAIFFFSLQFISIETGPNYGEASIFLVGSLRIVAALLPLQRAAMQLKFDGPQALSSQEVVRDAQLANWAEAPNRLIVHSDGKFRENSKFDIELHEVSFSYDMRSDKWALDQVTLHIPEGENWAIIGPSGAGKSTLAEVMLGLVSPSGGSIKIGGLPPEDLRKVRPGYFGYVPQKPGLISGSILDNITLGGNAQERDGSALDEAIRIAELQDLVSSLPLGLDTPIGKHADGFSGGQLQRIGLARALYFKPKFLILDEATSALDPGTENTISRRISSELLGVTKVIIAHRISTIRESDSIVVLDSGRIISVGKFSTLQKNDETTRAFFSGLPE